MTEPNAVAGITLRDDSQDEHASVPGRSGGKRREPLPVFLVKGALLSIALVAFYVLALAHYRIGIDPQLITSLPYRLWLIDTADETFTRGDYVRFLTDDRHSRFFSPGTPLVKRIVAVPGDHVVVTDGVVIVNGRVRTELYLVPALGKPEGAFDRDLIVPERHYWLMGTNPYSYDSRYWGLVGQQQVVGQGYPIW